MKTLENKVAIITGGTGALGRGVSKYFLEQGAKVLATFIIEKECEECKNLISTFNDSIIYRKTDVTDEDQFLGAVKDTIANFGKVDILINIVGGFLYKELKDTTVEDFDKLVDMNLKSCFIGCKSVIPEMIKNSYGKIVNISAKPAIKGASGMSIYGASKAGVARITEALAEEVKDFNISVNAIIPGTIDTPRNREDMPDRDFTKWVNPEELAVIIALLCSNKSNIISGAIVPALGKTL